MQNSNTLSHRGGTDAKISALIIFGLAVLLVFPQAVFGSPTALGGIISVPGDYATIGEALGMAVSGDTVQVAAGTYPEGELAVPDGVTLQGSGWLSTTIDGGGVGVVLRPGDGTIVQGFTVRGSGLDYFHGAVWIDHGTVTLQDNRLTGNSAGVWAWCFDSGTCNIDVTLERNIIDLNSSNGVNSNKYAVFTLQHNVVAQNGGAGVILNHANSLAENNILAANSSSGLANNAGATVQYNNAWGNIGGDYVGGTPGEGGISAQPLFRDLANIDYRLYAASPSVGTGAGGADMGVYAFTPTGTPPSSATATMAGCTNGQISWSGGAGAGYHLYYGPANRATTTVLDMGTATSHAVSGINESGWGYITVSAYDASQQESSVTLATGNLIPCPAIPENLEAGAFPDGEIRLQWDDVSTVEQGYQLERAQSVFTPTAYTLVATLPADTAVFTDTPPMAEETYWYRIRAYNTNGVSVYSNQSYNAAFQAAPNLDEQYLLVLINEARAAPGVFGYPEISTVPPVAYNPLLNYAARSHSQSILNAAFAFESRDIIGRRSTQRAHAVGYEGDVAENLSRGITGPTWVENSHQAFMDSEGHRDNMLCACFNEAGLGHTYDTSKGGSSYWKGQYTETFSSREGVTLPNLPSGIVVPYTGDPGETFTYIANYYHAGGVAPTQALVYINGVPYNMSLSSGAAANGTYRYTTALGEGPHEYYFHFIFDSGSARLPETGSYAYPRMRTEFIYLPVVIQ